MSNVTSSASPDFWSATLVPTLRQAPGDAEVPSHQLMLRAGLVRKLGSGSYSYLPLGLRSLNKVIAIIKQEMHAAGAAEVFLPTLQPIELWQKTGRDQSYGDNLFQIEDRHGRHYALGPTHEEVVTDLVGSCVSSYKDLPKTVYQIQTKFRDEFRPRFGVLRSREFLMKDAYSFHAALEGDGGLDETYDKQYAAYEKIFERCGVPFMIVEAEAGPIGGNASHEFMVPSPTGEDTILTNDSGYAANVEKCETGPRTSDLHGAPTGDLEPVETPGCPGIDDVCTFFKKKLGSKLAAKSMLKTLVFFDQNGLTESEITNAFDILVSDLKKLLAKYPDARLEVLDHAKTARFAGEASVEEISSLVDSKHADEIGPIFRSLRKKISKCPMILAVVRGDHEVNEAKLRQFCSGDLWFPLEETLQLIGVPVGFVGPHFAVNRDDIDVIVDPDAAQGGFWVTGGNQPDTHVKHFNWKRELGEEDKRRYAKFKRQAIRVADIRNAVEGDPAPEAKGGGTLRATKGIEVGHVFKLGRKYTQALGVEVAGEDNDRITPIMGCYGIGVNRILAAAIESAVTDEHGNEQAGHDASGIVWPVAIAPYKVCITAIGYEPDSQVADVCKNLAKQLVEAGHDVIIDDRDERPGVKFKDADLIGFPLRITVGDRGLSQDPPQVELKMRDGSLGDKGTTVPLTDAVKRATDLLED